MSAKELALNLLIKAKDMASGVVRNFKDEVEGSGKAAEELDQSLGQAEEGIDQLEAATDDAGKATGYFANQLTDADKVAGRYFDSAERMHEANGRFAQGARRARTEADKLGDELGEAGRKADGLSGKVTALIGRLKGLAAATAIGAGLKWFFEQSITSAARFERQMNRVEAVTNATAEEMAVLEKAAEEAGSTTEYSAVQAAEGLEILGRAGFNARQSVELLPSVLAVAAAEGVELAEAAGMISDTLAVMQMEVGKGAKVTDILAKGSSLAYTSMSELGLAISYAGQYAKPANLDLEQLVAILDVLAQNSLRGERGGTGLRSILAQLSDPASKAAQAIKSLNLPTDDFIALIEGLKQKGPEATEAINAFGIEAGPALRALISSGAEGITEFEQKLRDVDGAAKDMAKTATDDLTGGVKEAGSAWDGLIKTFGQPLLKPLTELARDLAAKFREMNESGNLKVWGEITAGALNKVAGSLRIIYNTATFATKAIGVFAGQIVSWVADAELQVAKLMNRIGLVGDETVASLKVQSGAVKAALNALVSEAEQDLKDMGAGWDLLSGKVKLGMDAAKQAADESSRQAEQAGQVATDAALTAEEAAKKQAQAHQEAAEEAVKLAQAQADAWDMLGHDVREVTGALTESGSAAFTAFETIATSGKASAEQINLAFASALEQAKTQADVEALKTSITGLGEQGKLSAEQVSLYLDLVGEASIRLGENFTVTEQRLADGLSRLGLNMDYLRTGMSEAGNDAVMTFSTVVGELDRAGESGEYAADTIMRAFENAFDRIETTRALEKLEEGIEDAYENGQISAEDFYKAQKQIEKAYEIAAVRAKASAKDQIASIKEIEAALMDQAAAQAEANGEDADSKEVEEKRKAAEKARKEAEEEQKKAEEEKKEAEKKEKEREAEEEKREKEREKQEKKREKAEREREQERAARDTEMKRQQEEREREMKRQQAEALERQLRDTVSGLETELARMNGNTEKVLQLQYEQQIARLQESLDKAGEYGSQEARQAAQQAIQLQQRLYQGELSKLKGEQGDTTSTARTSTADTVSTQNTKVVRLELDLGQGQPVGGDFAPSDAERLIQQLQRAGATAR